jgi:aminoglycoside phosphotransferase (APT) family kinase protein
MKKKKIIKLFEKSLNKTVIKISDRSNGIDQIVKIIETKNNIYVMKFPEDKVLIFREIFACEKLNGIIPVPKIIFRSEDFLIQEYITGESLDKINLSINDFKKVYFQIGVYLKKIHQIKSKGFGFLDLKGVAKYTSIREATDQLLEDGFRYLLEKNILANEEIKKVKLYFKLNDFYLNNNDSVLLHFDYTDSHIKVKNGKVKGIIDFGDLSSGPNSYDLGRSYIQYYGTEKFIYFMEGYGDFDLKEIEFYASVILINKIIKHHYKKRIKSLLFKLKLFKKIIDY